MSSYFLLLCLLLFCSSLKVNGEEGEAFHVVTVDRLIASGNCTTPKGSNGKSLRVHHRYGPCAAVGGNLKRGIPRLILQDQLRVHSLQQRLTSTTVGRRLSDGSSVPVSSGGSLGSGNYVVTIGIGTPEKDQTVIFDTGSNVCWVQCQPCSKFCHQQKDPVFDPSGSSSYRNVSCSDVYCQKLDSNGCSTGTCLYGVLYGDNSSTVGMLSRDTLTLTPTDLFPEFVFGCGQNNRGLFGRTAGLFGLGRGTLSVVSQTSKMYGNVFSYCLPATSTSTGDLTFGATNANSVSYTPMLEDQRDPSLYGLGLTGISVGGQKLPISPSVFSLAGTIIDSGTVVTRLPPKAYAALREAFRGGMTDYSLGQPLEGLLDTCYDMTGLTEISVPSVSLHFDGEVEVKMGVAGILIVSDISQVCLGFAGNGDDTTIGIIGNTQQRGIEVVYDLGGSRIGFGTGTCG